MALKDEIKRRYSDVRLIALSNPDEPTNTSKMEDRLDAAVSDTIGSFKTNAGVDYDNSNSAHLRYAQKGVLLFLQSYGDHADVDADIEAWEDRMVEKILPTEGGATFAPLLTDGDFQKKNSVFNDAAFSSIRLRPPRSIGRRRGRDCD